MGESGQPRGGTPSTSLGNAVPANAVPASTVPANTVSEALDGATGDYAVSGDAMRWSPELAEAPSRPLVRDLPGLEMATGLGAVLGLDSAGVRRLVTGALFSLTSAAGDVVHELRQLTRGSTAADDEQR